MNALSYVTAKKLIDVVHTRFFQIFGENPGGGYFRLWWVGGPFRDTYNPREVFAFAVGELPEKMRDRWQIDSLEKVTRLAEHVFEPELHVSSWQTRNAENEQHGGAIVVVGSLNKSDVRAGYLILSFAGRSEHENEALMLLVARGMGWTNTMDEMMIYTKSDNRLASDLLTQMLPD